MKIREDEKITNDLKRKRRYIETFFSSWVNLFDIERICVKSLIGFQLRLEQCFLVYTVQLLEINQHNGYINIFQFFYLWYNIPKDSANIFIRRI